jgi:catechol 2,3-dioxygenase-like lactoylglutathione lyase family enzyme
MDLRHRAKERMTRIVALDHLVLNVRDVDATAAWYERVLGMRRREFSPAGGGETRTALEFGVQKINLRPLTASTTDWFTARAIAPGSADLCFLTATAPDEVARHLVAEGVPIEWGPGEKSGARGTLVSVYCRDPDGSLIEISSYKT